MRATGEKNGRAKLTWEKVREIRERYKSQEVTTLELALDYDMNQSTIWGIVTGANWKEKEKRRQS